MIENSEIPMTPAEHMQRIRDSVFDNEPMTPNPLTVLANLFAQANILQTQIQHLESNMLLKEPPAGSRVAMIGPFLQQLRAFWARVFMRWYIVPMMIQQNQFNMATTQTLREVVATLEAHIGSLRETNVRISKIESDSPGITRSSDE